MFKIGELLHATRGKLSRGPADIAGKNVCIDSRAVKCGDIFVAIKGNNLDGHDFIGQALKNGAACVIYHCAFKPAASSKAVFIKVKDTTRALGDIASFWRMKFDIPVIVITGSNGKTTTKEMIAQSLSFRYKVLKNEGTKNNHIGLPMAILGLDKTHDFAVLEAGTNHPGEIGYLARIASANIAVITNIGPSHLEHLKSLQGVFREKVTLLKHLADPYIALLNSDNKYFSGLLASGKKKPLAFGFGIEKPSDFSASKLTAAKGLTRFLVNNKYKFTLPVLGRYNVYNALSAIGVCRICGMGYPDIAAALKGFSLPKGRLNLIKINNVRFIDDTYNANPLSLGLALETLGNLRIKGRKIFVMGDMLELGDSEESFHRKAGREAANICDVFIAVGRLCAFSAQEALSGSFGKKVVFACKTPAQAREILFGKIFPSADDIVLVKGSRGMKMEEVFKRQEIN